MPVIFPSDNAGNVVYRKFTTRALSTGVPTTLAGTPAISVYKDDSTTQSTAGVTLSVDFDGVTGLNHVSIDTSADGTFYANGHHYELVITTGTVGGTSVVGEAVGGFDLVAPTTVPTAAQNATAIFTDLTGGSDFTTTGSFGKLVKDNLDAAVSSRSTYAGADTSGTTTLLTRLTSTRAGLLDNLDAAVSTRSTYAGADTSGTTVLLGRLTATRAGYLDNLTNLDAAVTSRSTYAGADTSGTTTLLSRIGSSITISSGGVKLSSAGLNDLPTTEVSGVPANFREILMWLYQRLAGNVERITSGTDGSIVVKTSGGSTATTQLTSDDGAGNQTQGAVS